jgi:hypothetical protein
LTVVVLPPLHDEPLGLPPLPLVLEDELLDDELELLLLDEELELLLEDELLDEDEEPLLVLLLYEQ